MQHHQIDRSEEAVKKFLPENNVHMQMHIYRFFCLCVCIYMYICIYLATKGFYMSQSVLVHQICTIPARLSKDH